MRLMICLLSATSTRQLHRIVLWKLHPTFCKSLRKTSNDFPVTHFVKSISEHLGLHNCSQRILVVLVSTSSIIHNKVIHTTDDDLTQDDSIELRVISTQSLAARLIRRSRYRKLCY